MRPPRSVLLGSVIVKAAGAAGLLVLGAMAFAALASTAGEPATVAAFTPDVYLPIALQGQPIGRCADGPTTEEALARALRDASSVGFIPADGVERLEPVVQERLTAMHAERRYDLGMFDGIPIPHPDDCYWWFEFHGKGIQYRGPPGRARPTQEPGATPEPTPDPYIYNTLLLLNSDNGDRRLILADLEPSDGPRWPPEEPAPTDSAGTPEATPTPWSTPTPLAPLVR